MVSTVIFHLKDDKNKLIALKRVFGARMQSASIVPTITVTK